MAERLAVLPLAHHAASELLAEVKALFAEFYFNEKGEFDASRDWGKLTIPTWRSGRVMKALERFGHVLAAEARPSATYFVPKMGIYDTASLVDNADQHIPEELRAEVNQLALDEFRAAGRSLAFDLPSAAGFHALRAVESVLDDYYDLFGGQGRKKPKSWHDYISQLQAVADAGGTPAPSKKTIRILDQIRDLDRNPLMHPRAVLDPTEALVLFNLAASAIAAMAAEIRDSKGQPQLQLVSGGPDGS